MWTAEAFDAKIPWLPFITDIDNIFLHNQKSTFQNKLSGVYELLSNM